MGLKHSEAGMMKTVVVLAIMASLAGIAVGVATQTGGAVAQARTATAAVSISSSTPKTTHPAAATAAGTGNAILSSAASQAGLPYCYGGGGIHGPGRETNISSEPGCAPPKVGYDCMSLAQYAVYQGTGQQVVLPDNGARPPAGTFLPPQGTEAGDQAGLLPGDVVFFGGTIHSYKHSGIYAGDGNVWDALDNNIPVREHMFAALYSDYGNVYDGAYRYFSIATTPLPVGTTQKSYSATLHATGGPSPYTWSPAGSKPLPPGLKLGTTGVISGKATRAGTFSFEVRAVDTRTATTPRQTAQRSLTIRIT